MGLPSSKHNSFKAVMAVQLAVPVGVTYLVFYTKKTRLSNASEARYDQTLLNTEFHQNH